MRQITRIALALLCLSAVAFASSASLTQTTEKVARAKPPVQRTLSIIKPDGVKRNLIGKIISRFEDEQLRVVASRMTVLSKHEVEGFYAVHKERPFFKGLVDYMTSGPVMLLVLEGENAIVKNREIIGATDPTKAEKNTLRKLYAKSLSENTVHGSDAPETATTEIAWCFAGSELF